MFNKIKNWTKDHKYITGAGLLLVSIGAIAFGFAQFGPQNNPDSREIEDLVEDDEYNVTTY